MLSNTDCQTNIADAAQASEQPQSMKNQRESIKTHTQEEVMPRTYRRHQANQLDHEEFTPQLTARVNSDDEAHLASSLISSMPVTNARNTIEQIVLEEEERPQTASNL